MSDTEAIRKLAFEFANQLANPEFRRILRKAGGRRRRDVVVAYAGDTFDSVMSRAVKQSRPPVILFVKGEEGYTLARLEPKPKWAALFTSRQPQKQRLRILPSTTIGEVMSALEHREEAVAPERWQWFKLKPVDMHALAH